MKEKMKGMQGVERKDGILGKMLPLPLTALLCCVLSSQEGFAQNLSVLYEDGVTVTDVKAPEVEDKKETTIDWETAIQGTSLKDDDKGISTSDEDEKKPGITGGGDGDDDDEKGDDVDGKGEKDGGKIDIHGKVRGGSDVTPLLGSVLSDNPALLLSIDASHSRTGLGMTISRLDDFDKSMDNPASQMTILDFYWQKQLGKAYVMIDGEYTTIDKLSGADSFTPILGCTYDAGKGWSLDSWLCHTIQEGEDIDIVRLGVTKKLNESLSLAAQAFYRSDLSGKFYGRVQADINLGGGFGAQLSFIAKDGEITPTTGIIYKF